MADSSVRPTVCLCMIVKDEAAVIDRCLSSCASFIDHWVICDTGSTDGTQDRIRAAVSGVPGELHERPWVDFGHNRNELLEFAHGTADYLLLLDADETLTVSGELADLRADSYLLPVTQAGTDQFWLTKRLLRGDRRWRFAGVAREFVERADGPETSEQFPALAITHHADPATAPVRLNRDLALLTAALEHQPNDPRSLFYLGQTCLDLGVVTENQTLLLNALEHFQARADMEEGWDEEAYFAQHQVGVIAERVGDWPLAADSYMHAWEMRPARLESLHRLTAGLREQGLHQAAHRFARMAANLRPLRVPDDLLFVSPWIYEWGMLFEYSISSFWVGEYRNSVSACRALLAIKHLPDVYREQVLANLRQAELAETQARVQTRAARRQRINSVGSNTVVRRSQLAKAEQEELIRRAVASLDLPESAVEAVIAPGTSLRQVDVPAVGPVFLRPGPTDLRALLEAFENPAALAPSGLASAQTIVVLGAGVGISALFLGRLYPDAVVQAVAVDGADVSAGAENLASLGDRAALIAPEDAGVGTAGGPIDLLRVEPEGLALLESDPGWIDRAEFAIVAGPEPRLSRLLGQLRGRGTDAEIDLRGELVARRAAQL